MRANPWALFAVALFLGGCISGPPPPDDSKPETPAILSASAPWWDVGDWWLVEITNSSRVTHTSRLVNFWNETETAHFWLGVQDRDEAMEHAFFDTNPLLGRIHHEILAPHEKGMHTSMYRFPLTDNKTWEGPFLDGSWSFKVRSATDIDTALGVKDGYRVTGIQPNGARIDYEYVPALKWFSHLVERDANGREVLELNVKGHGSGSTGKYVFLQGRDFYAGPGSVDAAHDETFEVGETTTNMAIYVELSSASPWRLDVVDPAGMTQTSFGVLAAGGGALRETRELPSMEGRWTLRFVSTAPWAGTVLATGINEFQKTI